MTSDQAGLRRLRPGTRRRIRGAALYLGAAVIYTLITLAMLGLPGPDQIWGNNTTDVIAKVNLRAWQAGQAAEGSAFPLSTHHMLYPDGATLYLADSVGGVLIIPVIWALGPVTGYNCLVLGNLVFGCWAMFWLVSRLTDDWWVALLSGAIYGLCPLALGHVNNGVTEVQQTGWLPLFVGAVLALRRDAVAPQGWRKTAWVVVGAAGAWWFASVASHWYYGMYASLLFCLLVPALTLHAWDRRLAWRMLLRYGAAGLVFSVAVLPVVYVFLSCVHDSNSITRALDGNNFSQAAYRADPAFFFHSRAAENQDIEVYMHLVYVGFTAPVLALMGLARRGRRLAVVSCMLAAALFAVVGMGPTLLFDSLTNETASINSLLPFNLLSRVVPFFTSMDFPYRFFLLVHLLMALAVGLALGGWIRRPAMRALVCTTALVILLAEVTYQSGAPVPMPRQPVQADQVVKAIATDPEPYAVLDLPVSFRLAALNRYAINQVFHGRPIPYCNFPTATGPLASVMVSNSLTLNLLAVADAPRSVPPIRYRWGKDTYKLGDEPRARKMLRCLFGDASCATADEIALHKDLWRLREISLTRFVVHHELLGKHSRVLEVCDALFGPPVRRSAKVSMYVLRDLQTYQAWVIHRKSTRGYHPAGAGGG